MPENHEASYHYQLIARALAYIEARMPEQPPLSDIAADLGLSPAHFQRVFSAWVGLSPKRYQHYLALDLARQLLASRHTTLEAAHEAGLSGTGRLHDLFVTWEAMSPGAYARQGAGLALEWGVFPSSYGEMVVVTSERGICGIGFCGDVGLSATRDDLLARWPKAQARENAAAIAPRIMPLLEQAATPADPPLHLHLMGAPFQIKVWEALLAIPEGHVSTYSDIARRIERPRATRAVGTAVGRNPISWLIPCHRVLRKDGALGGYHWGLGVKRQMLAREAARTGWEG